jgi:hypothetical protein
MLTIQSARDPRYANAGATAIDLVVKFVEMAHEIPFTANPNDITEYGPDLYYRAVAGEYGPIAPYIPPYVPPVTE